MTLQRDFLKMHLEGKWENKKKRYKINVIEKIFPKYHIEFIPPQSINNEVVEHDEVEIRFGAPTDTKLAVSSSIGTWYLIHFSELELDLIPFNPGNPNVEKCCFVKVESDSIRIPVP
jgi:hypothetical protein